MIRNLPLLWLVPIGLHQIRQQRRLANGLYRVRDAALDAAAGLNVLRAAVDAVTQVLRNEQPA